MVFRSGIIVALVVAATALAPVASAAPKAAAKDQERFPSRDKLTALTKNRAPAAQPASEIPVSSWDAEGPFPTDWTFTPHKDASSPFQSIAESVIARRGRTVVASEAAHCAARELGRFFLAHKGAPTRDLVSWLSRLCTLPLEPVIAWSAVQAPEDAADDAVVEALRKEFEKSLDAMVTPGSDVGVWFGRSKDVAVAMRIVAPRKATFTGSVAPAADGKLTIDGETRVLGDSVHAVANKGADGFAVCTPSDDVDLPKFRLTCRLDPGDPYAYVDVGVIPVGRMLSHAIGRLMARPTEKTPMRWTAVGAVGKDALPVDDVRRETLRRVNERRTRAGLRTLVDVPAQSRSVTTLAPYYFAAGKGAPESWSETALLGASAGYELPIRIEEAWPASAESTNRDPSALFAALFESPGGRRTLMEPAASHIAIGPVLGGDWNGIFVVTYDELLPEEEATRTAELLERWERTRTALGRAPLTPLDATTPILATAAKAVADGVEPKVAVAAALEAASTALHRPVQVGLVFANSLSVVPLPDALVKLEKGGFTVSVAWTRLQGSAWGRYAIAYLAAGE